MSRWANNHQKKIHQYDGLKFDSATEIEFYKQYGDKYKRNEKSFILWYGTKTDNKITYTPDFIREGVWIEIKGIKDDLFSLREKLIMEYCAINNIKYYLLQYDKQAGKFDSIENIRKRKNGRVSNANDQLKTLWNLWAERKNLKDEEYQYIVNIMFNENKYSHLRNGKMVKKARLFNSIKRNIKNTKENTRWEKLKTLHNEWKQSGMQL